MSSQEGPARMYWLLATSAAVAAVILLAFWAMVAKIRQTVSHNPSICLANIKQINTAMLMYSTDYDNTLPPASNWVQRLNPYLKNQKILHCPQDTSKAFSSYGLNTTLAGMNIDRITNQKNLVMIFETKHPGTDPVGGPSDVAKRHKRGAYYGFLDGSAKWSAKPELFTPKFGTPLEQK